MNKLAKAIVIVVVGYLLFSAGYVVSEHNNQNTAQAQQTTIALNADTIFKLVNDERAKVGVAPLQRLPALDVDAKQRADDMVARNYFSHFDPVDGHKLINDQRGVCKMHSENLTETLPNEVGDLNANSVDSWLKSKAHHDAMLDSNNTLTGVAVTGNKVVQQFCTTL